MNLGLDNGNLSLTTIALLWGGWIVLSGFPAWFLLTPRTAISVALGIPAPFVIAAGFFSTQWEIFWLGVVSLVGAYLAHASEEKKSRPAPKRLESTEGSWGYDTMGKSRKRQERLAAEMRARFPIGSRIEITEVGQRHLLRTSAEPGDVGEVIGFTSAGQSLQILWQVGSRAGQQGPVNPIHGDRIRRAIDSSE